MCTAPKVPKVEAPPPPPPTPPIQAPQAPAANVTGNRNKRRKGSFMSAAGGTLLTSPSGAGNVSTARNTLLGG